MEKMTQTLRDERRDLEISPNESPCYVVVVD